MEPSLFHPKTRKSRGFTMIELLGAIFVLTFGLLALAGFMGSMRSDTSQSRYMETEALLASEKLEDLNRYPAVDPAMANGGALTGTPVAGYSDQVQISTDEGNSVEIITGTTCSGSAGYTTITVQNGIATSQCATGTPPAPAANVEVFQRQWAIEANQPASGVRRITVNVTLLSPTVKSGAASFQATLVRP
jgi:Tfp pilus assembly protein PilV